MENLITIELFGQTYRFKAETESHEAQKAANYLMEEVAKIQGQQGKIVSPSEQMTILLSVALNIAHQNIELKNNKLEFHQQLSDKSEKLLDLLADHA